MQVANELSRSLLQDNLVACVNIMGGIRSIYHWNGKIEEDGEVLLMIKTRAPLHEVEPL